MRAAKGCVLELLRDAYEARDQVAVVTFAGDERPVAASREAARRLGTAVDRTVVVDAGTESRAALTETVAEATEGSVVPLSALTADRIDAAAQR
jgi:Mg-chelatase subunit ChlD